MNKDQQQGDPQDKMQTAQGNERRKMPKLLIIALFNFFFIPAFLLIGNAFNFFLPRGTLGPDVNSNRVLEQRIGPRLSKANELRRQQIANDQTITAPELNINYKDNSNDGIVARINADKWYDPNTLTHEDMIRVEHYLLRKPSVTTDGERVDFTPVNFQNIAALTVFTAFPVWILSFMGLLTVPVVWTATQLKFWRRCPAQIIRSTIVENRTTHMGRGSSITYQPVVEYAFQYRGESYRSTDITLVATSASLAYAQKILHRYPVGAQVTAYANPRQPGQAVLSRQAGMSFYLMCGLVYGVPCSIIALAWTFLSI